MKKILLLGATGSIGLQTIDVIEQHPDRFKLVGIAAGNQTEILNQILEKHRSIQVVGIGNEEKKDEIHHNKVYAGKEAMVQCIQNCEYDLLVNAVVGFRGLKPTLESLKKGKDVALANKESLVAGGMLVRQTLKETNTKLYPIDSEHSAIFQCLQGNDIRQVKRLIITASGGSFRDKTREQLKEVTVEQTLKHPNWSMGKRITVDSATMVNKGFEVIEAHYLFNLPYEKIDVVVHPESIVHSLTEYKDHSILAQLAVADMRIAIQYALTYPKRIVNSSDSLSLTQVGELHFEKMDFHRFPLMDLAYIVGQKGGNMPAILNGANETAVRLFLKGEISFLDIERINFETVKAAKNHFVKDVNLDVILESDKWASETASQLR